MLDEMSRSCYVSSNLHREITTWEEFTILFTHTFNFTDINLLIHNALQHIHTVVLKVVPVAYLVDTYEKCPMQLVMECYNVTGGPEDRDDP